VGASAIGCDILKNFAMIGVGCEKDGIVFISDMNSVKKSDLH
jgi:ubiquitin-activating enzyme E1